MEDATQDETPGQVGEAGGRKTPSMADGVDVEDGDPSRPGTSHSAEGPSRPGTSQTSVGGPSRPGTSHSSILDIKAGMYMIS